MLALKREHRTEELLIEGYNYEQISAVIGVTPARICQYAKQIRERWRKENADKSRYLRDEAVKKHEFAGHRALDSYRVSKQKQEQVVTNHVLRRCEECKGTGMRNGDEDCKEWCPECGGEGKVMEETVTRTVKGQAGDSSFLREYRANVEAISKLEGLYPDRDKPGGDLHLHQHLHQKIDLSRLTPEDVLGFRRGLRRLECDRGGDGVLDAGSEEVGGR